MRSGKLHFLALAFTIALNGAGGLEIIRTQIRPAIEFVSGEAGLRPKSYFFDFSIVVYAFTLALKYIMAPGSSNGAEEDGGTVLVEQRGGRSSAAVAPLFL